MVALGIIESEFPYSSIQCDVYIFQLICLPASCVKIFTANNGYLPLTTNGELESKGLDFIQKGSFLYLMLSKTC